MVLLPLPRPARRVTTAAATLALVATGLASCSGGRPEPDEAAADVAAALGSFDLAQAPLVASTATGADQQLADAVADLGELRPTVSVQGVEEPEDGTAATASLSVTWDLDESDQDWSYVTELPLVYDETDEAQPWRAEWSLAVLEPSLTEGEHLQVAEVASERADILGAGGAVLVTDRPVLRVGIDKTRVPAEAAAVSAQALAELVDIEPAVFVGRVAQAGPSAFVEAIVLRDDESYPYADGALDSIAGAVAVADELPLAPTPEFARPVLGRVGEATAEIIEASEGEIAAGDMVGLSGLQQRYDEQLRGEPGLTVQAVPTEGEPRVLFTRDPTPGEPLATTLDPVLQQLADDALAAIEPASAVVMIKPSTGDVLAVASGPGGEGLSTATTGLYAPGSTFKIVSSLALLRAGLTLDSPLSCTPTITVDGKSFKNYGDYPASAIGDIPFREALANSCNTAFISAREQAPQPALAEAAASLGLGVDHDLGLPAFFGTVPADAGETEHAASMIGQGQVVATPLAMAAVAASVARGATVVPRVLAAGPDAAATTAVPLEAGEAEQLRQLMQAVVSDGSAAFLSDVPGEPVGAKTGTAEYGTDAPPRTHAWMIAFQGDLAVSVFVEDGDSGSRTAGPILERLLRGAR